jgi:large subunit ribosomal protein L30
MTKLRLTQVRSVIHRPKDQKATVRALGLHRIRDIVVKDDRPEIRGMIAKVAHLVRVEEVEGIDGEISPRTQPKRTGSAAKRPAGRPPREREG